MKLIEAPVGLLNCDDTIILKTEYSTTHPADGKAKSTPDCYIVESGEYFWGGVDSVEARNNLEVTPVEMPTLTPQNETPPCYQPDGDGCAYQCYDGQDEPIEKCKECPLCYSDKQRHHTAQNEPLTIEQLREMDGAPVWLDVADGVWALVDADDNLVWLDRGGSIDIHKLAEKAYRRPPERQEELP